MLLVADQPLSQSHKHDEQSDSANSEFASDGPEEYEGEALPGYLEVLYNASPAAVGGEMPDNSFYFA